MNFREGVLLLLLAPLACSSESKCKETFSCGDQQGVSSAGVGNGDDSGSGYLQDSGSSDSGARGGNSGFVGGGDSGSGGTAGMSGGGDTDACAACSGQCTPLGDCLECTENDHCTTEAAPRCNTETFSCVGCTDSSDCSSFAAKPICDAASGACVQCMSSDDCGPSASVCDTTHFCQPCEIDADCEHLSGTTLCDNGECVECTGTRFDTCAIPDMKPRVCDSLSRTCTTEGEHGASLCEPCISDAHCQMGQRCVLQQYDGTDVGYFCFWEQGSEWSPAKDCLSDAPPFASVLEQQVSIDGVEATICGMSVSTCISYGEFQIKDCAPTGTPDDTLCGFEGGVDGSCRQLATDDYRCTMPCGSDYDCPGSGCKGDTCAF